MLSYLPRYYETSLVMQAILEAQGQELDSVYRTLNEILEQFFVQTATWGLRYWEEACGLPTNEQEPIEARRARVLAKLRSFPSARRADIERVVASFVAGYFDILEHPRFYSFYVRVAWNKVADLNALVKALDEVRPAHIAFGVVGIPDRMFMLNHAGTIVTVTQDLSWRETKAWKVFTGPRLNASGAVEAVTEDVSWSETITFKVFTGPRLGSLKLNQAGAVQTVTTDEGWDETVIHYKFTGPRLNGPTTLRFNGIGRQNEGPKTSEQMVTHHEVLVTKKTFPTGQLLNAGPTSTQQQTLHHLGSRTYKRFVAPLAALNARGTVIEDVVDHGWDETITEHRFTGPRFNSPLTLAMTGQARLNAGPKTSEQVVVHHPVLEVTVKNDGGTLLNRGPTETRQEIINHPDVRTYKKFNPEVGMVLNSKPVLGYMWKKELKEAV
ncbi:YmfQ family protein [Desulfovirgula thermocuniculi]|uniref:YmfQ family protein n=1 Tax=Desulfovirgula thermocuniculi TaxID=348842 RepID=UPI0012EB43D0|nr:YmfQ family protein [Desulfovirgula thermocuniculi]